jgi:ATP/maltotriose-dependent transcriptional regulator MalT
VLAGSFLRAQATCAKYRGDFEAARRLLEDGIAPLEELGENVYRAAMRGFGLGDIAWLRGDYAEAERVFREAYEQLTAVGEQGFSSTLALFLAESVLRQGREDEAAAFLAETKRLTSPGDMSNQVGAALVEGLLLSRRGDIERAVEVERRGLERALTTDSFGMRVWALRSAAEVLRDAGRREEARELLEQMLAESEAKEATAYADRARALLAEL